MISLSLTASITLYIYIIHDGYTDVAILPIIVIIISMSPLQIGRAEYSIPAELYEGRVRIQNHIKT